MTRLKDKQKAIELRKQGKTYQEIRSVIPNLSKGTLCGWVKNIELSFKQKERILKQMRQGAESARSIQRQRGAWTNHINRIRKTEKAIQEAKS